MEFIHNPGESNRLGDWLKDNLERDWTHFRAAVAFVKRSGTRHIAESLGTFAERGHIEIVAGIDHRGTSYEGLLELLRAVMPNGRIVVFHNRLPHTFHPKITVFKSETAADLVVGSGNLTEGGLFTNYEASLRIRLNLDAPDELATLQSIERTLDGWGSTAQGTSVALDERCLNQLREWDLVATEALMAPQTDEGSDLTAAEIEAPSSVSPFAAVPVRAAPRAQGPGGRTGSATRRGNAQVPELQGSGFLMTLQHTDVSVGQTDPDTSRRSPEIFIPLAARNADPTFWDWPDGFVQDESMPGKFDRRDVRMRLDGKIVMANMMYWPPKHEFRVRSEALRSAGDIGHILRMEKARSEDGFDYDAEVIPPGADEYPSCFEKCDQLVRNSKKRFGYY